MNEDPWIIDPSNLFAKDMPIDNIDLQNFDSYLSYSNNINVSNDNHTNNSNSNNMVNWNEMDFDYNLLNTELEEQIVKPDQFIEQNKTNNTTETMVNENSTSFDHINKENSNSLDIYSMEKSLLQKQLELNEALEKQKEVNLKLEEQLRNTQLQQKKLQNRLKEQEDLVYKRFALGDITSSSRLNSTPSKKNKEFNISKSNNTSPSKKSTKLLFVSPAYSGSIQGSPKRRSYRSKSTVSNNIEMDLTKNIQKDQKLKINFATTLTPRNQDNFITESSLSSPTRFKNTMTESPTNSNIGNVSPVLGLGLKLNNEPKRNSITFLSLNSSSNSNSCSNSNSPIRQKRSLQPVNSTFQDTPIKLDKYSSPMDILSLPIPEVENDQITTNDDIDLDLNIKSDNELLNDFSNVPSLIPPNLSNSAFDESNNLFGIETTNNSSPIMNSPTESTYFNDQISSNQFAETYNNSNSGNNNINNIINVEPMIPNSPSKITRKLTTLPRGSIDKFVKELSDKTFECLYPKCGKFFKRRYNIRSHIQTHLEDRPYACDFPNCNKAFVRNHDLVRHKKSHCEKTYGCPCGKMFNREDALLVHRSRLICIGGKKYDNVVIKRSPRKRGRPRKDSQVSNNENEIISQTKGTNLIFRMDKTLAEHKSNFN